MEIRLNPFPTGASPLTSKIVWRKIVWLQSKILKGTVAAGTVGKGLKKADLETELVNPFQTVASLLTRKSVSR